MAAYSLFYRMLINSVSENTYHRFEMPLSIIIFQYNLKYAFLIVLKFIIHIGVTEYNI